MFSLPAHYSRLVSGTAIALVTALAAIYLADRFSIPVMLVALLLGMAMNFVYEEERFCPGINFTTSLVLRAGVALLGLRITLTQIALVGWTNLAVVSAAVACTIVFGALLAPRLNKSREFGVLTGGSVSICGASAAIAIATILPNHPDREKQVVFTVLVVTTLSTIAMILYPVVASTAVMTSQDAGLFLGGTIHDVAQVVGAGYSMSSETGDFATITKLYRVLMLLPVFLAIGLIYRQPHDSDTESELPVPWFVLAFIVCMLIASFEMLPKIVIASGLDISHLCLVMAIAALGMKTNLKVLLKGSSTALLLVTAETVLLFGLLLAWIVLV